MKKTITFLIALVPMVLLAQNFEVTRPTFDTDIFLTGFGAGDFDGDGDIDFVGVDDKFQAPNQFYLFRNQGGTTGVEYTIEEINMEHWGQAPLTIEDYDGDGDLDFLTTHELTDGIEVFRNDGTGQFSPIQIGVVGPVDFKFGDYLGDGDMDLVGVNNDELRLYYFFNNDGFLEEDSYIDLNYTAQDFDMADFDGDGDLDVVLGYDSFFGEQIIIYKNRLPNNIIPALEVVAYDVMKKLRQIEVYDWNNDGQPDILGLSEEKLSVFINQGNFNFEEQVLIEDDDFGLFSEYSQFTMADYNGDGKQDFVISGDDDGVSWYANTSEGTTSSFEKESISGGGAIMEFESMDINQDGKMDVLGLNFGSGMWIYENKITPSALVEIKGQQVKIAPNPSQHSIQLINLPNGVYDYHIVNQLGQLVERGVVNTQRISLDKLSVGLYALTLTDISTGEIYTGKIIKR